MKWLIKHWENLTYIVTTIITLISGTVINIEALNPQSVEYRVFALLFYVGLSLSICFILLNFPKLKEKIDEMTVFVKQEKCIFFGADDRCKLEENLVEKVKELKEAEIYYFCYGTNRFGQTLDRIVNLNECGMIKAKIHLVMCNPKCNIIQNPKDKKQLYQNIEWCVRKKEHFKSLYLINPPKTYRACMVENKRGKTVWSMMQPYSINPKSVGDVEGEVLFKTFGRTPILSADIKNGDVLSELVNMLKMEYKDVVEDTNNDTVVLIEKGEYKSDNEDLWRN